MLKKLALPLCRIAWRFPGARLATPEVPIVLLYHEVPRSRPGGVEAKSFEEHVKFLQKNFELVAPGDVGTRKSGRTRVMLTFDDGFKNNAEVVAPILKKERVPALFFISSRHCERGKYLWFHYLRGLERYFTGNGFNYQGEFWEMRPEKRRETMARLWKHLVELKPHPAAMYEAIDQQLPKLGDFIPQSTLDDFFEGMTPEQVGELASDPLFTVGNHTHDHPYLTQCDLRVAEEQILRNKIWLEKHTGKPCDIISYPIGDYNQQILETSVKLGFHTGHAVQPSIGKVPAMEIERLGIYSASTDLLGFKVTYGLFLRKLGLKLG
ncbi:MAG: polysaccharide deacetylase family protein [Verrucomicrobiota bacterium]|nr:polysaccharide deacetylase family protein [Verrucomicrobiota bacterium]